jgi:hypothetical protein
VKYTHHDRETHWFFNYFGYKSSVRGNGKLTKKAGIEKTPQGFHEIWQIFNGKNIINTQENSGPFSQSFIQVTIFFF